VIPTCERLISWRGKSKGHLNRGCAARCRSGGRCQVTVRTELLLCGPKTAGWAFQLRRPHILGRFISRAAAMMSCASSISSVSHLSPSLISAPPPRPFQAWTENSLPCGHPSTPAGDAETFWPQLRRDNPHPRLMGSPHLPDCNLLRLLLLPQTNEAVGFCGRHSWWARHGQL
jgi:hypothetical protein